MAAVAKSAAALGFTVLIRTISMAPSLTMAAMTHYTISSRALLGTRFVVLELSRFTIDFENAPAVSLSVRFREVVNG